MNKHKNEVKQTQRRVYNKRKTENRNETKGVGRVAERFTDGQSSLESRDSDPVFHTLGPWDPQGATCSGNSYISNTPDLRCAHSQA